MANQGIDLVQLFQTVTGALAQNKEVLNQADEYNHNHGDNMVEIFEVITQAMKERQDLPPADQLEYAAQLLRQRARSGSAQVYAEGLRNAARTVQGAPQITPDKALQMVQALLGAQPPSAPQSAAPQGSGDVLGTLLSGLMGGGQGGSQPAQGGDLLTGLLGALGGQSAQGGGMDLGDLINAGMAFMQARQSGQNNVQALASALLQASPLAQQPHRARSGEVVAGTLLQQILSGLGR